MPTRSGSTATREGFARRNLDDRLRTNLGGHQVFTASYNEWEGLKNGKLLEAAEDGSFEVLVTGDQTLCDEQNLTGLKLAVVALSTVEWRLLKDYLPRIDQRRPLGIYALLDTRQEPLDATAQIIGPILVRAVRNGLEGLD